MIDRPGAKAPGLTKGGDMMIVIDRARQAIVDMSSLEEIRGAVAIDTDSNEVTIRYLTHAGERFNVERYPAGLKVVRK
jgi:hypothetical protein